MPEEINDAISEAIAAPTNARINQRIRQQIDESSNLRIGERIDRRIIGYPTTEGAHPVSGGALLTGYEPLTGRCQLGGLPYG